MKRNDRATPREESYQRKAAGLEAQYVFDQSINRKKSRLSHEPHPSHEIKFTHWQN